MKLFEYQAKDLFETHGIPVPKRICIDDCTELEKAINKIGLPCVVKAQVLQGGRGKAGLIQLAKGIEEAKVKANKIFKQTGRRKLLIEEAVHIDKELYVSITAEPVSGSAVIMACANGGVDIEDIAQTMPNEIIKMQVELSEGLLPFKARNLMYELGIDDKKLVSQSAKIILGLYDIFREYDAELVEINPLMVTKEGILVAGDGKITLDDNALFRHSQFSLTREYFDNDVQYEAAQEGIPYLQFDGDIGLMCAGAGLTNTVFDLINDKGGSIANYLEFGGPNYHKAVKALTLMMKNKIKVLLVVTFGTIARADVIAQGLVDAIKQLKPEFPIVTAIRGTGEEEAHRLLRSIKLEPLDNTEEAVEKAIALAGGEVK